MVLGQLPVRRMFAQIKSFRWTFADRAHWMNGAGSLDHRILADSHDTESRFSPEFHCNFQVSRFISWRCRLLMLNRNSKTHSRECQGWLLLHLGGKPSNWMVNWIATSRCRAHTTGKQSAQLAPDPQERRGCQAVGLLWNKEETNNGQNVGSVANSCRSWRTTHEKKRT